MVFHVDIAFLYLGWVMPSDAMSILPIGMIKMHQDIFPKIFK
jgi:hypothetical protein